MIEIFEELDKFSNIKFQDEGHIYTINGEVATSCTTLIGKYEKPFEEEYWSKRKADEEGIPQQEMLDRWKSMGDLASLKGTQVHNYLEYYLNNKIYQFSNINEGVVPDKWEEEEKHFYQIVPMIEKFCSDIKGKMIPIKSELVIGDEELMITGMIDQVFYNKKSGLLELWDWKTNKKIDIKTRYKLLKPVNNLSTSKLDLYSLQLGMYKYLIEQNTNLKFGDSYICWFHEKNDTYKTFKCVDTSEEIKKIVKDYSSASK